MFLVKTSKFAKTIEGQKIVKRLDELYLTGSINMHSFTDKRTRGHWSSKDGIRVGSGITDAEFTASELVHEATHAVDRDEHGQTKSSIDEEMRTNTNQLDFYEEQRKRGFVDFELNARRTERIKGKLRDNVRSRYKGTPEHRP